MIQTTPYSQSLHRNQTEYQIIADALREETVHPFSLDKLRQMPLPQEITIIRLPHFGARDAGDLLSCRTEIETHLDGQICTATASGLAEFDNFVKMLGTPAQPRILREDQAHLFEHLIYQEADRVKLQDRDLDATVTIWRNKRQRSGHRDSIRYVVVLNNTFRQPEFDELLTLVWHWLGQALNGSGYPTAQQLAKMVRVRNSTLRRLPGRGDDQQPTSLAAQ